MANLNRVFLIGNLTRDPELRYIPSGTAVANLGLAVGRRYRDQSGDLKEETCFIRVVVWGKQAESCNQYLTKGRPVFVEGRLQSRSWETPDGQRRTTLEVRANRVQFLGRPKEEAVEAPAETREEGPVAFSAEEEVSQAKEAEEEVSQAKEAEEVDKGTDSNIPF